MSEQLDLFGSPAAPQPAPPSAPQPAPPSAPQPAPPSAPQPAPTPAPALTPSTYTAPPKPQAPPATRTLSEEQRAAIRPMLPHPSEEEREEHVLLTIRPGGELSSYMSRRAAGWVLQVEELVAQSEDPEFKVTNLKDLVRMSIIASKQQAAREAAQIAQANHFHQHNHNHLHNELPDLSHMPADKIADLARIFQEKQEAARQAGLEGSGARTTEEVEVFRQVSGYLPGEYRDVSHEEE